MVLYKRQWVVLILTMAVQNEQKKKTLLLLISQL